MHAAARNGPYDFGVQGSSATNLGPVGPHEPILTTIGNKQIVAFYVQDGVRCSVDAVMWEDVEAKTATRVRISLTPGEIAEIDDAANESLNLQCGVQARSLAIVDKTELATVAAE